MSCAGVSSRNGAVTSNSAMAATSGAREQAAFGSGLRPPKQRCSAFGGRTSGGGGIQPCSGGRKAGCRRRSRSTSNAQGYGLTSRQLPGSDKLLPARQAKRVYTSLGVSPALDGFRQPNLEIRKLSGASCGWPRILDMLSDLFTLTSRQRSVRLGGCQHDSMNGANVIPLSTISNVPGKRTLRPAGSAETQDTRGFGENLLGAFPPAPLESGRSDHLSLNSPRQGHSVHINRECGR